MEGEKGRFHSEKEISTMAKDSFVFQIKPSPIGCIVLTCGLFGASHYLMNLCICQCLDAVAEHVKFTSTGMQTEDDVLITEQGRGRY